MSPQEALKMMRAEIGLTQQELSDKLSLGCTTINRWENGKSFPSRSNAKNILRIAKEMNASAACISYLKDVLMPSRMRGRSAADMGFPDVDKDLLCHLIDHAAGALFLIDAKTKKLLYVNRAAQMLAGRPLFKLNGMQCYEYVLQRNEPCENCPLERFPVEAACEKTVDVFHDGRQFQMRTQAFLWNKKLLYVAYLEKVTEECRENIDNTSRSDRMAAGRHEREAKCVMQREDIG